jgi:hypothetical protein
MVKHFRFQMILLISFFLVLTGCFRNPRGDAETEFNVLMDNQFSASGSDLAYAACGWPVSGKMKLKALKLDLFPDSTSENGRGYAEISTEGDRFTCGGKLFFIYNYSYTGGHGYSGSTDLKIEIIQRESAVDEKISNPPLALQIETGKIIEGELSETDMRLPDNTPIDYYSIELKGDKPAIKFTDVKGNGISIKGSVYQNRMFVSGLSDTGMKLKQGRAVILITAGGKTGRYSFKAEELSDAEKSGLR